VLPIGDLPIAGGLNAVTARRIEQKDLACLVFVGQPRVQTSRPIQYFLVPFSTVSPACNGCNVWIVIVLSGPDSTCPLGTLFLTRSELVSLQAPSEQSFNLRRFVSLPARS